MGLAFFVGALRVIEAAGAVFVVIGGIVLKDRDQGTGIRDPREKLAHLHIQQIA